MERVLHGNSHSSVFGNADKNGRRARAGHNNAEAASYGALQYYKVIAYEQFPHLHNPQIFPQSILQLQVNEPQRPHIRRGCWNIAAHLG